MSPEPLIQSNRVFDEFSPKRFIILCRNGVFYLLSKWKVILAAAILGCIVGATYSFIKAPVYAAEITFALDEGAAQSEKTQSPGLAQELGFSSSLEAGGVFSSMTNIIEMMQSRLLIEKTLRSHADINDHKILFADFFLDSLGFRDKWMKKSPYYHLDFNKSQKDPSEILFENGIMGNIYEVLSKQYIKIDKKGKSTSLISVICTTKNQSFSKFFLEAWLVEVTRYYVDTRTERAKLFLDFIQKRADSIKNAYHEGLLGRASFTDANVNPARLVPLVTRERKQTDIELLRTSYVDLIKSAETAKTSLMRDTPLIQYLDKPIFPLKILKPSLVKWCMVASIAFVFICIFFLLVVKGYRIIIASN